MLVAWEGERLELLVVLKGEWLELLAVQFVVAHVIHEVTCYTCRGRCTCPVATPAGRTNIWHDQRDHVWSRCNESVK